MAPVTAQRVSGDMAGDNRDVADLCKDALKTYKGIVGFDLERKFENFEAVIHPGHQGDAKLSQVPPRRHVGRQVARPLLGKPGLH